MSKKVDREIKLREICKKISQLSFEELQDQFPDEYLVKLKTEIEQSTDLSIESRIVKYNNPKTIDSQGKVTLGLIVDIFKNKNLNFQKTDLDKIEYFTSKINTLIQGTNYSGVGIDNRINLIKDGPNNDVKGHSINLVELFNEFKLYDKFSDFVQKSSIDKAFIENKTFLSHIRYLYSICKSCENIDKYPFYYKQWQLFGLWFFGIPRHDYDSFCFHYNSINDIGDPKLLNFASYYYLLGLKLKNDVDYQLMIAENDQEKRIIEELIWADRFPSEPLDEEFISEEIMMNREIKFKEWLKINMPNSADKYFSYFNTANKISQFSELGNLFYWSKDDWEILEIKLREVPDFIEKNSTGHNSLTASIGQYKKFISMENFTYKIPPRVPFSDFKWRWAVTTPSESINSEGILFGVLKILAKHNGNRHATQEFKEDLLRLQKNINSPIDLAKVDRDLNKNIIENSGQYWKALGLLNTTTDGTISVTDLGLGIANGVISKDDFVKYLYENLSLPNKNIESELVIQTFRNYNISIYPIKILFNVLYSISKTIQSPSEWYLTPEELKDIIVPLSVYDELDYDSYAEYVLLYRNDKSLFTDWPDVTPGDNDFRMLKEYLIFLSNFGYLDLVELKDKTRRYYINKFSLNTVNGDLLDINDKPSKPVSLNQNPFETEKFKIQTNKAGLIFSSQIIQRFIASLTTKPFVICSGLSGSGKTKLAQSFVRWICESNKQYKLIPVGSDWTNREPLLGYPNGLNPKSYITPDSGALQLILEAAKEENQNKPYFMILDEMNLSHVERYFADFLSVMESKEKLKLYSGGNRYSITAEESEADEKYFIPQEIEWPYNLFIIGTVNIDETTYMFSPKVLDRANVIEFRITQKEMENFFLKRQEVDMKEFFFEKDERKGGVGQSMAESFLRFANDNSIPQISKNSSNENVLNKFFNELQKVGSEFGYRGASEIELLLIKLGLLGFLGEDGNPLDPNTKIDIAIMQKLLPKLHGSRKKLVGPLETLAGLCISRKENSQPNEQNKLKPLYQQFISENRDSQKWSINYPISFEKIERMLKNLIENGFTSYAEA
jgi:hypothetical protein